MRASELKGEAKQLFEQWRSLGYTESQALDRVQRSGLVREPELYETFRELFGLSQEAASVAALGRNSEPTDDHGRLVDNFKSSFGLSESAAQTAADGRDGPSSRPTSKPVSEAGLSSMRPDPANIRYVVAAIEGLASDVYRRGGVSEQGALRDAACKVMLTVPDERTADWVARIAHRFWPQIYSDSGSSGTVRG